jgi:hypothetical protein
MLDDQILHALEERWQTHGAETLSRMEPGLSDDEIDRAAAALDFDLPDEVRTLFRWRDGSGLYPMIWTRGMTSLEQSIKQTHEMEDIDQDWPPGWFNVMNDRPYVIFDCTGAVDAPVPVWHYDFGPLTRPVFASVGEMFAFWIDLIDDGTMYWDGDMWQVRQPLPDDIAIKLAGVPLD